MTDYCMYRGESLLHIGTLDEIAELHGVKRDTVYFYSTPTYQRRIAKRKNARNFLTVTKIEEEEE